MQSVLDSWLILAKPLRQKYLVAMRFLACAFGSILSIVSLAACDVGPGYRASGGSGGSGSSGKTNGGYQVPTCSTAQDCYPDASSVAIFTMNPQCLTTSSGGYCTHVCSSDSDCCIWPSECPSGQHQVCVPFSSSSSNMVCAISCGSSDIASVLDLSENFWGGDAAIADSAASDSPNEDSSIVDSSVDSSLGDSGKTDDAADAPIDAISDAAHDAKSSDAGDAGRDADSGDASTLTPDEFCNQYARKQFHCRSTGSGASNRKACLP
jgi:hypothetical protein